MGSQWLDVGRFAGRAGDRRRPYLEEVARVALQRTFKSMVCFLWAGPPWASVAAEPIREVRGLSLIDGLGSRQNSGFRFL